MRATRYLSLAFVFLASFMLFLPLAAVAQVVADSVGVIPPSGPIGSVGVALIGVGASLLTGLVAGGARAADGFLGNLDSGIRRRIGPALPAVTVGLSIALPLLTNAIGLSEVPDASIIATAPTSAIVGIAAREALRKWIMPLVARRGA